MEECKYATSEASFEKARDQDRTGVRSRRIDLLPGRGRIGSGRAESGSAETDDPGAESRHHARRRGNRRRQPCHVLRFRQGERCGRQEWRAGSLARLRSLRRLQRLQRLQRLPMRRRLRRLLLLMGRLSSLLVSDRLLLTLINACCDGRVRQGRPGQSMFPLPLCHATRLRVGLRMKAEVVLPSRREMPVPARRGNSTSRDPLAPANRSDGQVCVLKS